MVADTTHLSLFWAASYMISKVLSNSESQQVFKMPDTQELFQEFFLRKISRLSR